jgi:RNA polymerase sigma-70 factor, ECF subfamily
VCGRDGQRPGRLVFRHPPAPAAAARAAYLAATVRVRRYLHFLGCAPSELDDLTQQTLLAAVANFATGLPPLPWLLATARNCLRMHLRRAGHRPEVAGLDSLHQQWIEQVGNDAGDSRLLALRGCLRDLSERSRLVVERRYGEGLSRAAIAMRLGLGEEGVKSLLARVRAALGDCVQRRLDDD